MNSNSLLAAVRVLVLVGYLAGVCGLGTSGADAPSKPALPAPDRDRVGFPKGYQEKFQIVRTFTRDKEQKLVTVYVNRKAGSITNLSQVPYPYGSVLVMETSSILQDAAGKPQLDEQGRPRKDKVTGLHVMRREKGFGAAYGENRAGEWEYMEYRPDGSYLTPPRKSATCAECHRKAGLKRDFVYRGRLPAD